MASSKASRKSLAGVTPHWSWQTSKRSRISSETSEGLAQVPPARREDYARLCTERDRLQRDNEHLSAECDGMKSRLRGEDAIRRERLYQEQNKAEWLAAQKETILQGQCEQLLQDNKRLRAAYQQEGPGCPHPRHRGERIHHNCPSPE